MLQGRVVEDEIEIDIDEEEEEEIKTKGDDDVCVFVSYHPSSLFHMKIQQNIDFTNTNLLERESVLVWCGGAS